MFKMVFAVIVTSVCMYVTTVAFAEEDKPVVIASPEEAFSTAGVTQKERRTLKAERKTAKVKVKNKTNAATIKAKEKLRSDAKITEMKNENDIKTAIDEAFSPKFGGN